MIIYLNTMPELTQLTAEYVKRGITFDAYTLQNSKYAFKVELTGGF